ncbi:hypothetical protein J2755_001862 [Methanohalophilus levihalophilus]|nr:hypothetical protein [Methanohalophilus levihalophilus]
MIGIFNIGNIFDAETKMGNDVVFKSLLITLVLAFLLFIFENESNFLSHFSPKAFIYPFVAAAIVLHITKYKSLSKLYRNYFVLNKITVF